MTGGRDRIAATTGGDVYPVPAANELAAVYAELAGTHRGAAMALPRTDFDLYGGPKKGSNRKKGEREPEIIKEQSFPIYVEFHRRGRRTGALSIGRSQGRRR